ncbi:GNAT family N-acetyltransferase [Methylophaga thiooxydans]|uniref:GNAT family N-acetyltransferase n=1 Tax=Methylophaga thiooxydans TaxID=392484 RepID=UPI002357CDEF|nr:GNAT family N-acetyltransferase [Methylophaga thiooxydans]
MSDTETTFFIGTRPFVLRQLQIDDLAAYLTFFNSLDAQSMHCRFGYMISALTADEAALRIPPDAVSNPVIAIFDAHDSKIFAIGRLQTDKTKQAAEIAVVVTPTMRRQGLATRLLDALITHAQQLGLSLITAYIVTQNAPVIDLLTRFGFMTDAPITSAEEDGELKLSLNLNPAH